MGFTVCTVGTILCPLTLDSSKEKLAILKKEKPFNRGKDGRNLGKTRRGGIPLTGRTDMQNMSLIQRITKSHLRQGELYVYTHILTINLACLVLTHQMKQG